MLLTPDDRSGAYQRFGLFVPRLSAIKQKGTVQKMLWKYELACKAEGLSDEEIRKIRKIFRDDQERLRYEKQTRKELGITIISLSSLVNEDSRSEVIEPADPNVDVEKEVMHQIEIDMIRDCLSQMKTEDADACAKAIKDAGYKVTLEPQDLVLADKKAPFPVRVAFCIGPVGEIIELFCERLI